MKIQSFSIHLSAFLVKIFFNHVLNKDLKQSKSDGNAFRDSETFISIFFHSRFMHENKFAVWDARILFYYLNPK